MNNKNLRVIYFEMENYITFKEYFKKIFGVLNVSFAYKNIDILNEEKFYNSKMDNISIKKLLKVEYDFSMIALEEVILNYFRLIDFININYKNFREEFSNISIYYDTVQCKNVICKLINYNNKDKNNLNVNYKFIDSLFIYNNLESPKSNEEFKQNYGIENQQILNLLNKPLFNWDYKRVSNDKLKLTLDSLSYSVLTANATETAYTSVLNNEFSKGIYVDKITREPLFSSKYKFKSGCGWPSFSKPILSTSVKYIKDTSYGMQRIEVRSNLGDYHLGHVFDDGLEELGGLRYCINGAAIEFIPYEKMLELGYSEYIIFVD